MTTAVHLLDDLADAGVAVAIAPDGPNALDLDGPAGTLTPELVERVKVHKPELLTLLRVGYGLAPAPRQGAKGRPAAHETWRAGIADRQGVQAGAHCTGVPRDLSLTECIETGYVNRGWTAQAWADRLCQLADRCEGLHPELATQYRTWAANVLENEERLA